MRIDFILLLYQFARILPIILLWILLAYCTYYYMLKPRKFNRIRNSRELRNNYNKEHGGAFDELPGNFIQYVTYDRFVEFAKEHKNISVVHTDNTYFNFLQKTFINKDYICIDDNILIPSTYDDYKKIMENIESNIKTYKPVTKEGTPQFFDFINGFYSLYESIYVSNYFSDIIDNVVLFTQLPYILNENEFVYYDKETKTLFSYLRDNSPFDLLIYLCFIKVNYDVEDISKIQGTDMLQRVKDEMDRFMVVTDKLFVNNPYWIFTCNVCNGYVSDVLNKFALEVSEFMLNYMRDYKNINSVYEMWGDKLLNTIVIERSDTLNGHPEDEYNLMIQKYGNIE